MLSTLTVSVVFLSESSPAVSHCSIVAVKFPHTVSVYMEFIFNSIGFES